MDFNIDQLLNIMAYVVAVNLFLSGLAAALYKVKDLTKSDADNKLYAVISKASMLLSKIIDFASANIKH